MASISSEESSERYRSYSLSADVSESESCSSSCCNRFESEAASTSMASSPPAHPSFTGNQGFPTPFTPPLMFPVIGGKDVVAWEERTEKLDTDLSEIEMMKERFAKLLLGEDMSGGGKGVCTVLAISNAITNRSEWSGELRVRAEVGGKLGVGMGRV